MSLYLFMSKKVNIIAFNFPKFILVCLRANLLSQYLLRQQQTYNFNINWLVCLLIFLLKLNLKRNIFKM
jgi:hypothetical protein